jgi:STE24 endopeptidase
LLKNGIDLPDPLHSAFYDSHPPATIRIGKLNAAHQGATQ